MAASLTCQFGITDYDTRIGTPGDHVSRVDLRAAREVGRYVLPDGLRAPHGVKLRPASNELFVNAESGGDEMLVYDVDTRRLLRRFSLVKGAHNFVFSPDGRSLFLFAGPLGVAKYDPRSGKLLAQRRLATPVRGLRLAADGSLLAAAKGQVAVLNPADLSLRRLLAAPTREQLVYLEALKNGVIVAPSMVDGVIWFARARPSRFIPTGNGALAARLGPDGRIYVSNVDDDHLTVMNVSGRVVAQIGHGIRGSNGLSFGACPDPKPD